MLPQIIPLNETALYFALKIQSSEMNLIAVQPDASRNVFIQKASLKKKSETETRGSYVIHSSEVRSCRGKSGKPRINPESGDVFLGI